MYSVALERHRCIKQAQDKAGLPFRALFDNKWVFLKQPHQSSKALNFTSEKKLKTNFSKSFKIAKLEF